MKLLLENWRQYLNESKIHPKIKQIIDGLSAPIPGTKDISLIKGGLVIEIEPKIDMIFIRFAHKDPNKSLFRDYGQVSMRRNHSKQFGDCLNGTGPNGPVYSIQKTEVKGGRGPLLYEIAIEYASQNGAGLVPDRYDVSNDALGGWQKYMERGDVRKDQLDIVTDKNQNPNGYPQLTPEKPSDDCHQKSAVASKGEKWFESPLSKVYTKNNIGVMRYLQSLGILRIKERDPREKR